MGLCYLFKGTGINSQKKFDQHIVHGSECYIKIEPRGDKKHEVWMRN